MSNEKEDRARASSHPHDPACEKLSAFLDDELPDELRQRVVAHLMECRECKDLHDDLAALIRCCAEYAPMPRLPEAEHELLMDVLRRETAGGPH